jgi:hypothetical protein
MNIYVVKPGSEVRISRAGDVLSWRSHKIRQAFISTGYESLSRGNYMFRDSGYILWVPAREVKVIRPEDDRFVCGSCGRDYPRLEDDPWVDCGFCLSGEESVEPVPVVEHVKPLVQTLLIGDVAPSSRP